MMDLQKAMAALKICRTPKYVNEVNPLSLAIGHEFATQEVSGQDYRVRAIARTIKAKVPFKSEFNSLPDLLQVILVVKCPYCAGRMRYVSGGGATGIVTSHYRCLRCKADISISLPPDGVSVRPADSQGDGVELGG
jgi:hypothetical protein